MAKVVEKSFFFFFSEFFVEKTQSNCLKSLITKILDARAHILRNKTEKLKSIPREVFLQRGCSKTMQQIFRRTPMRKCDFNKVGKQLQKSYFHIGIL